MFSDFGLPLHQSNSEVSSFQTNMYGFSIDPVLQYSRTSDLFEEEIEFAEGKSIQTRLILINYQLKLLPHNNDNYYLSENYYICPAYNQQWLKTPHLDSKSCKNKFYFKPIHLKALNESGC